VSPFGLDDLISCLALADTGDGTLEGPNLDIGYHRVFGGQVLAQVVAAAAATSPGKAVKSLSVLFPREGDTAQPVRYRVERLQDGRTFGTSAVTAGQGERVIAAAVVSLHVPEAGLHRSDAPPPVGAPRDAEPIDLGMVPWEVRAVAGVDLADRGAGPPRFDWWMRTPAVADDPTLHQALLAHATDLTLIGTALRPFDGISQADSTVTLHTAVTSHALWFHQPFRVDDWLLVSQHSPVVAGARAFGRGDVFAGGELVASFAQESMVRQIEAPG
jgi:acyl-CoA thioesterase-2